MHIINVTGLFYEPIVLSTLFFIEPFTSRKKRATTIIKIENLISSSASVTFRKKIQGIWIAIRDKKRKISSRDRRLKISIENSRANNKKKVLGGKKPFILRVDSLNFFSHASEVQVHKRAFAKDNKKQTLYYVLNSKVENINSTLRLGKLRRLAEVQF